MGNSSARLLKKRNKRKSILLLEGVKELFSSNDIFDDYNLPDIDRVLKICKAIKPGIFDINTTNDFSSFKYPYNRLTELLISIKFNRYRISELDDYIQRMVRYSEKIYEKYQAANRDAIIDDLLG